MTIILALVTLTNAALLAHNFRERVRIQRWARRLRLELEQLHGLGRAAP